MELLRIHLGLYIGNRHSPATPSHPSIFSMDWAAGNYLIRALRLGGSTSIDHGVMVPIQDLPQQEISVTFELVHGFPQGLQLG